MTDVLFLAVLVVFFAVAVVFVHACERIIGPDQAEAAADTAVSDAPASERAAA